MGSYVQGDDGYLHYPCEESDSPRLQFMYQKFMSRSKSKIWKCRNCNAAFFHHKNKRDTHFCSRECYNAWRRIESVNKILDQLDQGTYSPTHNLRMIKKCLISRYWEVCQNCKQSKHIWLPIPLEVHHKDWDSINHRIDNLMLICPNCHTFTDNYKSKNKSSSRKR